MAFSIFVRPIHSHGRNSHPLTIRKMDYEIPNEYPIFKLKYSKVQNKQKYKKQSIGAGIHFYVLPHL